MQAEAEAAVRTRRQRRLEQKSQADRVVIDQRTAEYRAAYEAYLKKREEMDPIAARRFASQFRVRHTLLHFLLAKIAFATTPIGSHFCL